MPLVASTAALAALDSNSAAARTDSQGVFRFRGFYGKYVVKVAASGRSQEFRIDLAKDARATHKLTLKP